MNRRLAHLHLPRPPRPPCRGAALLIVLGVLMITVTAATILLTTAADLRMQRDLTVSEDLAFDLLHAAEAPIQHWLEHEAAKVVLPPDSEMPRVTVLDDRWTCDQRDVHVTITAFDQLGMVPMQVARSGSPLRLALLPEVTAVLDAIDLPPASDPTPLGLDLVKDESLDGKATSIFPSNDLTGHAAECVGALLATHNRDPVRINVNTAPRALLDAALRAAGRGGVEQILAARRDGRLASPDVGGAPASPSADPSNMPRLVGSSDCWSLRIDIRIGSLLRSWWAIYQPGADDLQTPQQERWRCVQRLPITQ